MELRQLRYLVAVADTGSFTAAARQVFVTQPTLSSAIAALEGELATRLFDRTSTGATPTDAGHEAIAHARIALRAAASVRSSAAARPVQRIVRLGVAPAVGAEMLLDAVRIVQAAEGTEAAEGAVSVHVEEGTPTVLSRRLRRGRLDVTLTVFSPDPGPDRHRWELGSDSMGLAYPDGEVPDPPVTPEVLHGRPLIVRTHCDLLSAASRILDDRRIRPVVTARTDSDGRALALVAAGHGACLVPDSLQADGVTVVTVEGVDLTRHIGLEWRATNGGLAHLGHLGHLDGMGRTATRQHP
jgi:DNA-binding transcriptional LysR family regulator